MFLAPTDLEALTGYVRPADQCRWLRAHGYKHERAASGRPVVLIAEVERRLLSKPRTRTEDGPKLHLVQ